MREGALCSGAVLRTAPFTANLLEPQHLNAVLEGFHTFLRNIDTMSLKMPRAVLAKLRKTFPQEKPDVAHFDFPTLAAWHKECLLQRAITSTWTRNGRRWRRAAIQTDAEYTKRLLTHPSASPGMCDACQMRTPTTHVAYQPMEAPRFAHYCETCLPNMPVGWMCISTFGAAGNR